MAKVKMTQEHFEERVNAIIGEIKGYGFGMLNDMIDPQFIDCNASNMSCRIRYKKFKWEDNGRGEVHGGVVSAMMDTTMGINAIALTDGMISTSDMSVSFIRPFCGKSFIIESEVIKIGQRLIRLAARAYDEETGKCLATSSGNFMFVDYEHLQGKALGV